MQSVLARFRKKVLKMRRMACVELEMPVYYSLIIYKTQPIDQCVNKLAVSQIFIIKWSSFHCILFGVHLLFLSSFIAKRAAFSSQPSSLVSPLFFRLEIGNRHISK